MEIRLLMITRTFLRKVLAWIFLGLVGGWLLPVAPALAQGGAPPSIEKPAAPEEKKEEAPTTTGPMLTDTTIPLEAPKVSMSLT